MHNCLTFLQMQTWTTFPLGLIAIFWVWKNKDLVALRSSSSYNPSWQFDIDTLLLQNTQPLGPMKFRLLSLSVVLLLCSPAIQSASGQGVWGINSPIFSPGPGWGQGWRPVWVNRGQPSLLGKVSIKADYNYDGFVNGRDNYVERGLREGPLGLIIGTNEMAKVELTCVPTPTPKVRIGEPKIKMK